MSGAFGAAYGIQREDEDLAAMVEHTAVECVFGPANGGLFALHGAIGLAQVRRWPRTNRYCFGVDLMMPLSGARSPRCSRYSGVGVWVRESCSRFTRAWIGRSAAGNIGTLGRHCCAGVPVPCRGWLN